jgi:hypothetical protein
MLETRFRAQHISFFDLFTTSLPLTAAIFGFADQAKADGAFSTFFGPDLATGLAARFDPLT